MEARKAHAGSTGYQCSRAQGHQKNYPVGMLTSVSIFNVRFLKRVEGMQPPPAASWQLLVLPGALSTSSQRTVRLNLCCCVFLTWPWYAPSTRISPAWMASEPQPKAVLCLRVWHSRYKEKKTAEVPQPCQRRWS